MSRPGVFNGGEKMPDWLTHSLIGWITGKTTKIELSLVVIGSLIPDISKLYLGFNWLLHKETQDVFLPIHTPFGAVLIACAIACCFPEIKKALIPLGVGVATHFVLDLMLLDVSGGIPLLFPFSWVGWQFSLFRSEDYLMTVYAIIAAVVVFVAYSIYEKRKSLQKKTL
jgi:hypothetical protein